MFLKVYNVGAERMSSGRLFQATGPATQYIVVVEWRETLDKELCIWGPFAGVQKINLNNLN